ncbi:hypothetical protein EH223_19440 [candidate division KSB1 bacterium]|nr:hypothetical protein [candidate division KSB1 bacterium]RQW00120.1 MAG: hypothetical protein EH223_19440 [candidate division KSB1 bacterium]
MFHFENKRKLYPIIAVALMFCMCAGTGTDYSGWYDDEPEGDLLGGLMGEESASSNTSSQVQQPPTNNQGGSTVGQQPGAALSASPGSSNGAGAAQGAGLSPVMDNRSEVRTEIAKESKMRSQNKIEITFINKVRTKANGESRWRAFDDALVSIEDNNNLMVTYASQRTDKNGVFRVVLQPAEPFTFFSFVPFEETGFTPHSYTVPVEALDLNTITFTMQSDDGVWHTFQYSYQTYDLRPAISSFVNAEINSKTVPVTIRVFGSDSRYPIQNAKVTIDGNPPSRLRLLSKYFQNIDILNYALRTAPQYVVSSQTIYTNLAGAQFNLYSPFEYTLEVSHPDYFYTTQQLQVPLDTDTVDIYLDRLFTNAKIIQRETSN